MNKRIKEYLEYMINDYIIGNERTFKKGDLINFCFEDCEKLDDTTIGLMKPISAGENVILKGDDLTLGEIALIENRKISGIDIGVLAALGLNKIDIGNIKSWKLEKLKFDKKKMNYFYQKYISRNIIAQKNMSTTDQIINVLSRLK